MVVSQAELAQLLRRVVLAATQRRTAAEGGAGAGAAAAAAGSPPRTLLITGERGAGKSHVVRAVLCDDPPVHVEMRVVSAADWLGHVFEDGSRGLSALVGAASAPRVGDGRVRVVLIDHLELLLPNRGFAGDSGSTAAPTSATDHTVHDQLVCELAAVVAQCEAVSSTAALVLLGLATDAPTGGANTSTAASLAPIARSLFGLHARLALLAGVDRAELVRGQLQHNQAIPRCVDRACVEEVAHDVATRTGGLPAGEVRAVARAAIAAANELVFDGSHGHPAEEEKGEEGPRLPCAAADAARWCGLFVETAAAAVEQYRGRHPSGGHCEIAATSWDQIAGHDEVKRVLRRTLSRPLRCAALYQLHGVTPSVGVVLHGPPGTGKTMLARAMAAELKASFVYVDLPALVQAEVGESERVLEGFFALAWERSPALIFVDEMQAAFGTRDATQDGGKKLDGGSHHEARLVSCLLQLLDAARMRFFASPVVFVGATNALCAIDPAVLGAGRLDTHLYVGAPDAATRRAMITRTLVDEWGIAAFEATAPSAPAATHWAVEELVTWSHGFSGAELRNLLSRIAFAALAGAPAEATETPLSTTTTPPPQPPSVDRFRAMLAAGAGRARPLCPAQTPLRRLLTQTAQECRKAGRH